MAPSSSSDIAPLAAPLRHMLLAVASESIRRGLAGVRYVAGVDGVPARLCERRASFVTLHSDHRLRGCIGSLDATRSLIDDVAHNAYAAAFEDPRFAPLSGAEFERLSIHLSVLSTPEPICFSSERELLSQLRPRVDGLVLEAGFRRGTFLPSVWEQLPEPVEFLRHLKLKAGLAENYWSPDISVKRYTVEAIS